MPNRNETKIVFFSTFGFTFVFEGSRVRAGTTFFFFSLTRQEFVLLFVSWLSLPQLLLLLLAYFCFIVVRCMASSWRSVEQREQQQLLKLT